MIQLLFFLLNLKNLYNLLNKYVKSPCKQYYYFNINMSLKIEIIDDFLDKGDLNYLQNLQLKNTPDRRMNVYVKKIDAGNKISRYGH